MPSRPPGPKILYIFRITLVLIWSAIIVQLLRLASNMLLFSENTGRHQFAEAPPTVDVSEECYRCLHMKSCDIACRR